MMVEFAILQGGVHDGHEYKLDMNGILLDWVHRGNVWYHRTGERDSQGRAVFAVSNHKGQFPPVEGVL